MGPVLDPNCLQKSLIDDTGRKRIKCILYMGGSRGRAGVRARRSHLENHKWLKVSLENLVQTPPPPPPPPATRLEKRSETRDIKSTLYFQILGSRYIKALFTSEKMVEETACHPVRGWLSNYSDVCNFTLLNGGASWYCVKPSNRALLCEDWTSVRTGTPYQMFPLTHTEYKILR